jgi:hypothetical protein
VANAAVSFVVVSAFCTLLVLTFLAPALRNYLWSSPLRGDFRP